MKKKIINILGCLLFPIMTTVGYAYTEVRIVGINAGVRLSSPTFDGNIAGTGQLDIDGTANFGSSVTVVGGLGVGGTLGVTGHSTLATANTSSLTSSSLTVTGNAFSVGGSTLVVTGGKVGIGNTAPTTKLHVSSGTLTVDGSGAGIINSGFTTLGSAAPAIKMITISTTTAMTEGGNIIVAHGLTASKIISMSAMALVSTSYFPPNLNYSAGAGYEYQLYHNSSDIIITNHATLSENILNKPLEIVITYKE